jgi:methyl-accepting chemotaxis protein
VVTINIAEVSRGAAQTGSAASQVLGAAGKLSRQSEMLQGEVERFLLGIRSASDPRLTQCEQSQMIASTSQ